MPAKIPHDPLGRILHELKKLGRKINRLNCNLSERIDTMAAQVSQEIQELLDEVTPLKDQTAGIIAALNGFADRLDEGEANKAAIKSVTSDMRTTSTQMAAAILANTPAGPVVPPVTP